MPIKNFLYRFQPAPLYIVLTLSICYFSVQLILSHLTHALTLLMASYHMLCNIFALAGSIITIKHNELHNEEALLSCKPFLKADTALTDDNKLVQKDINPINLMQIQQDEVSAKSKRRQLKTRNTFGWARIEILTMLIVCITLASLSFSLLVEALQTLIHIDHQDTMHLPVHVMILGFVGLLLNGFTYFVIGGYTLHQGSFLHINPSDGKVIVEPSNITIDNDEKVLPVKQTLQNGHHLKDEFKAELGKVHYRTRREGPAELLRDVSSTIFVIVCAVIVYFAEDKEHTSKFIDPILSIFSCVLVVALSYSYMKEACLILLQTIPGGINMENFENELVRKFPQIVSYHDLHIWQLSSHKYIATVHIIFKSAKTYTETIDEICTHFHDHHIAHVTIQPEFYNNEMSSSSSIECLVQCLRPECLDKVCCKDSMTDLREVSVCPGGGKDQQHDREHSHDKNTFAENRKNNDNHDQEHSNKHGHGHSHGHSNKHDKHNHRSHVHSDEEHGNQIHEVPKENLQINIMETVNSDQKTQPKSIKSAPNSSHIPPSLFVDASKALKASKESSTTAKPEKITETSDLNQTKAGDFSTAL